MQSYSHFTLTERESLRIKLGENKSIREIARELGRSASSISREIKRNGKRDGTYNAWHGNNLYLRRRKRCLKKYRLHANPELMEFVCAKLKRYWPPEQIAIAWTREHPDTSISHSTIYSALKRKLLPGYSERTHLRRRGLRKYCKGTINPVKPTRNVAQWPEEIRNRVRIGDWEGDTLCGGKGKGFLVTCVDRKSRYLTVCLLSKNNAQMTTQAVCAALKNLPVHSLTLDNGVEFAGHRNIEAQLDAPVFFADPHSPWQRGTNENTNGLLRFFFPRGSDFRDITQEQVDEVAELLNTRPRKCLGGLSPIDVFRAKCCT